MPPRRTHLRYRRPRCRGGSCTLTHRTCGEHRNNRSRCRFSRSSSAIRAASPLVVPGFSGDRRDLPLVTKVHAEARRFAVRGHTVVVELGVGETDDRRAGAPRRGSKPTMSKSARSCGPKCDGRQAGRDSPCLTNSTPGLPGLINEPIRYAGSVACLRMTASENAAPGWLGVVQRYRTTRCARKSCRSF